MKRSVSIIIVIALSSFIFLKCNNATSSEKNTSTDSANNKNQFDGFANQVEWGKHLVMIGGCNDCHTPKKMTPMGPVPDTSLLLSGHPAKMPAPDVNRKEMENKGYAVTKDLTAWVGPWGISYSANLTPDKTGIGEWSDEQFIRAIREGKWMGLEGARQLLPPMPWQQLGGMRDDELKAIFAYLKSIKPVNNLVPQPVPPVTAHK
jgi:Cytochrome c